MIKHYNYLIETTDTLKQNQVQLEAKIEEAKKDLSKL
jgi:hypothetical protein